MKYIGFCLLLLVGCSLQLVAPYDPPTATQINLIEKKIDYMYRKAEQLPPDKRQYQRFAKDYIEVDVEIRALLRRQQRRPNNTETIKQVDILSTLWEQDKMMHYKKNALSNFMINRRTVQYQRMFTALVNGENAKKQRGSLYD
ncbi:hypothetical protein QWZ16_12805 [Vibrio ostreicida]|uniref:Uncharacterized protein n=2 Tax=Vibrio ostreicida TaxID=526588 RepID=A0ABT8BV59_9VIBR|nr:hypothetical protein [Vibrio ostreicida]MDN3610584.1 hypothetical protein [Vibrio ostreicida]